MNRGGEQYYVPKGSNKTSKSQLITMLKIEQDMYLPPNRNVTSDFLRKV